MSNPDRNASDFLVEPPNPLRYTPLPINYELSEAIGAVREIVPSGSRVLDIGCGTGWTAKELIDKKGCEVIGVEPNESRAEVARSNGIQVHVGYLEDLRIEEVDLFDIVLFGDVLEHLSNPLSILCDAKKYLRPGGSVVVSVPNVAHWMVRLDLLRGRFNYQQAGIMDATHLRWFTEKTLRLLLENAGYRVDEWRVTCGNWMPEYASKRPFRWMRESGRHRLVKTMTRWFPRLFGCQFVMRASIQDTPDRLGPSR